jgi:hypothetical protein
MATEYQYIDYTMTPIYSSTSGIASPPSIITKDNSMDMANPSAAKKLYLSNQDSPYYNPEVVASYPIPITAIPLKQPLNKPLEKSDTKVQPIIIYQKDFSTPSNSNLYLWLFVFLLFVLIMTK